MSIGMIDVMIAAAMITTAATAMITAVTTAATTAITTASRNSNMDDVDIIMSSCRALREEEVRSSS
eukprot:15325413-Ditylum_brightwellii.AAC.1